MAFSPKTSEEYTRDILGVWYALTGGMDISEGSPDAMLASALGLSLESLDARLRAIQAAFGLNARGADLDERVAEIMSGQAIRRGAATAATGPALRFTREDTTTVLTIPSGAQIRSRTNRSLVYRLEEDVTLVLGQGSYPAQNQTPARVSCLTPGKIGNVNAIGALSEPVPNTGIPAGVLVTNITEVGGGEDEESDESLAQRAQLLISSIAKAQPKAIEALAARFVSSEGVAIRQARLREPAGAPGYSELIVSDGFGLTGFDRPAQWITGTSGPLGTRMIAVDGPMASEPRLVLSPDPNLPLEAQGVLAGSIPNVVVLHERGQIEFINGAAIPPNTPWAVGGHRVYTGPIAELQERIEGSYRAGQVIDYGWRAAGCRVRVRRSIPTLLDFRLRARFRVGIDESVARQTIVGIVIDFLANRPIGAPFSRFRLIDEVAKYDDVEDFEILSPEDNLSPESDRHQFVASPLSITFL